MGEEKSCGDYPIEVCKAIIGFISISTYLVMHQLDFISRHFAVAFNIPTHNTGIYFNKLYSLRCVTFVISGFIENRIFQLAGGDKDPIKSTRIRRYVGIGAIIVLFAVRCVYLFLLYSSSQLSYHIYLILVVEGLSFGFHDAGFMTLGSEYISIVSAFYNVSRIFVSGCQFILDRIWYQRPLLMIKMQAWIALIFTAASVALWYNYNIRIKMHHGPTAEQLVDILNNPADSAIDLLVEKISGQSELQKGREEAKNKAKELEPIQKVTESQTTTEENNQSTVSKIVKFCRNRVGKDGIGTALSPMFMYWASTMFKDFLFPATLPYGILARDKCHIINVMIPIFMNLGPATYFVLDNFTTVFNCWSWYFDLFWVLFIPLPILLTFVLRAMLTRDPAARRIINSRPRVTCMTFMLMVSFGFMEPLSYMGLGKYAFRENPGGYSLMGFHVNLAMLCRAIFSRISLGFSDTRISLGYHLPKFRPNHRMSKKNLGWYLFRQTFRRAWKDAKGDYKLDIKKYL